MLQKNVAFDLENYEFKTRLESEIDKVITPPESLVNGRYIIGCVFERVAKKERNNQFHNYKIAFEYAGDGMKDMMFSMEEIHCNEKILYGSVKKITEKLRIPYNTQFFLKP